ncbi:MULTISPECIES: hypothetical protein [unclassified Okeania]|uniref:hypothetical protein n=1 Tax=unclassified Okeania TaxID=2634635 RepID=UPI0013BA4A98|nr:MULTISPECIES: hypothetical protein [unclassified Okeania]NET23029.1 hypothetical protein [Okeania sp. SIO1H5]NET96542.1 hypothetical protein [Okeania sp. SIO1H2]
MITTNYVGTPKLMRMNGLTNTLPQLLRKLAPQVTGSIIPMTHKLQFPMRAGIVPMETSMLRPTVPDL